MVTFSQSDNIIISLCLFNTKTELFTDKKKQCVSYLLTGKGGNKNKGF